MEEKNKDFHTNKQRLFHLLEALVHYQQEHHFLARLVHREMTLDTTLVRELMSTYSRKEKHEIELILRAGMQQAEFHKQPVDMLILQIRHLLVILWPF